MTYWFPLLDLFETVLGSERQSCKVGFWIHSNRKLVTENGLVRLGSIASHFHLRLRSWSFFDSNFPRSSAFKNISAEGFRLKNTNGIWRFTSLHHSNSPMHRVIRSYLPRISFTSQSRISSPSAQQRKMSQAPVSIHDPATADGWHGVIPSAQFPAEKGRYHLYIGLFCPFAHRANFVRHLKGLADFIDISIVKPYPKGDANGWPGWRFPSSDDEYPGSTVDHLFGEDYLHKVYFRADPEYKGRYSVPLLWDTKTGTAVCNVLASSLLNLIIVSILMVTIGKR